MTAAIGQLGQHSDLLFESLCTQIEEGRYRIGGRLPSERELSKQFEVSRPTVRRALAKLQAEGYVDIRQGAGAYVRRRQAARQSQTISVMISRVPGRALTRIQDYLLSHDCLMCVFSQARKDWDHEAERSFLLRVLEERHRALLCFCSPVQPYNEDVLRKLEQAGVRVIHIDYYKTELPEQEFLLPDYEQAGYRAAVSLLLKGCAQVRFASFSGPTYVELIERGVIRALGDNARGDIDPESIMARMSSKPQPDEQTRRRLREIVEQSNRSVGFVCRSPRQAEALHLAAVSLGYRVPEEIRTVCVAAANDESHCEDTDTLEFDETQIILRAASHVLENRTTPLRELVSPRWRDHARLATQENDS